MWTPDALRARQSVSCVTRLIRFFFFQAEDGIRDDLVTGVQTCALPILAALDTLKAAGRWPRLASELDLLEEQAAAAVTGCRDAERQATELLDRRDELREIGRASCRERV